MSEPTLFDIPQPEWVPVAKQFGLALESLVQDSRCRDCGRRKFTATHGCAGADARGIWELCDDCASLDGCLTRESQHTPGYHCSHWGITHSESEHDALVNVQSQLRAKYLRESVAV